MENKKVTTELEQKAEKLKQVFKDFTIEQKELLLYRIITEIGKIEDNSKGFNSFYYNKNISSEELLCLIKAADIGYLKPLVVYSMRDYRLKYQEIYKESLICYNNILKNYKILAQELKINSSLDLSHFLTYLLWNGYFSVNKKHSYKLQDRLMLPGMYSFDVIKGGGVCLAYAELLHNYLSTCEKNSAILNCKVPTEKNAISCDYRPKIERDIKSNISSKVLSSFMIFFLGGLINKVGNHSITLIEENGKIYAYDPTNIYALNIKDSQTASIINGKGEFQIKPLMTFMLDPCSDPNHIFDKLLLGDIKPAFSRKDFIFSFENLMELINDNISLLDDAYNNIHDDLKYIDKQTNEIGGNYKVLKRIKKNNTELDCTPKI